MLYLTKSKDDLNKAFLGAAIATLISYFAMSCIIYFWNKSVFSFKYNWNIILGMIILNQKFNDI